VPVKNLDTQLLPAALCKGDIAAFFIWQPIGSRTLEICPNDAHQLSTGEGYIQGYLVAGARPEFLNSADGADKVVRFLRAVIKGRAKAEADFPAVAAFAAKTYSLSEKATKDQWDTNIRPVALDKIYYDDFCSLSKWAQGAGLTSQPLDFSKLTWPNGLRAIDAKLVAAPPSPC
jgi:ABC-type nitrate/sulfonate/bicarbonate transport system substrate-binding protein